MELVWSWFGSGLALVWSWFGAGLELVWRWFGAGLELVWRWFGAGLELVWIWFSAGLELVWSWFGAGLELLVTGVRLAQKPLQPLGKTLQLCCLFVPDVLPSFVGWFERRSRVLQAEAQTEREADPVVRALRSLDEHRGEREPDLHEQTANISHAFVVTNLAHSAGAPVQRLAWRRRTGSTLRPQVVL